jgi:hypothetical protein
MANRILLVLDNEQLTICNWQLKGMNSRSALANGKKISNKQLTIGNKKLISINSR